MKTAYADYRGRLNAAIFRSEFDDIQLNVFTGTQYEIFNAKTALTQGIEIENTFAHTEHFTSFVAVTYLDDTSFGSDNTGRAAFLADRNMPAAPEWAGVMRLNYDRPLNDMMNWYTNLNVTYMGDHWIANNLDVEETYTILGLAAGLRSADDVWDVSISCKNCTDETYFIAAFNQPFYGLFEGDAAATTGYLGEPRTVALSVSYHYF